MDYDLVVRGGVVTTVQGTMQADLGIQSGKIAQVGGAVRGAHVIDANGMLVLPGGVDVHVHLTTAHMPADGPKWSDDFASGTAAALAGGITTVGNMSFLLPGELPLDGLSRDSALVRDQALCDVILHPVLTDPSIDMVSEIPKLIEQGHNSIKFFMTSEVFDHHVLDYLRATSVAGASGMITMIHCEDKAIIDFCTEQLVRRGNQDLSHYGESRPAISEVVATERAIGFSRVTGAPIYVVHLSSAEALEACVRAKRFGAPVYVETRPLYLHLTEDRLADSDGAKYVGQPPLRATPDVERLWAGLRLGEVDTLGSDHAPWSLAQKLDPALSVARLRPGVENLETEMSLLYSEGVRTGKISLERMVAAISTNPAKLFGLYPRKGAIAIGADADLVIFDPNEMRIIGAPHHSESDYSAFEGFQTTGWPVMTLSRGEVVFDRGQITAHPGRGQLAHRGPVMRL